MTIPIWLLGVVSNGLLAVGSFWIVRDGLRQARGIACFLGTAVVFWAGCTVGLEVLSAFGAISAGPMLGWSAAWLIVGGLVRWVRGGGCGDRNKIDKEPRFSPESVAALGVLIAAAVILGMRSLLLAVKVVSDGPIYHLYFAVRWWKAGRLILVAAPFGENAATYFPANGDLWFTWLLASWGGDRLAKVGQAPFLLLAMVAAFGCARALGARRSASLIATCWFASSMPLLLYSFEPNVDTIFVAGYMMATYFVLEAIGGEAGLPALFLGALAAGCALGTKSVGMVFIPPLLALAGALVLFSKQPLRSRVAQLLVVFFVPLFTGGYWYGRNALLTGNALYPLDIQILGNTLARGWYGRDAMRLSPYYMPSGDWRALVDTLMAVVDPRLAPIWVLAVLGAAWWGRAEDGPFDGTQGDVRSGRRADPSTGSGRPSVGTEGGPFDGTQDDVRSGGRRNRKTFARRTWAAGFGVVAVINVALYWVFIPYRSQQRFMLQALGLAAVPLALLFDRARWLCAVGAALLGLHLLSPECWPWGGTGGSIPWDLSAAVPNDIGAIIPLFSRFDRMLRDDTNMNSFVSLASLVGILVIAIFVTWAWCRALPPAGGVLTRGRTVTALVGTGVLLVLGYADIWVEGEPERFVSYPPFDFYLGWQQLEAASGPKGARVAYAGTNIPYYLFGSGLRNDVRYVNVDGNRDWLLHDYHRHAIESGDGTWPNPRPGWDRAAPYYTAWLNNLDAAGTQILVVTRVNPAEGSHNVADRDGFPIERGWAESHPDRFETLYGARENDPWFRLYRVRRPGISAFR